MTPEDERKSELYQRAAFGQMVEQFWGTQIGQYLAARAQEYYNAGIQDLKEVDPMDYKAVFSAQNKVFVGENFNRWLSEAVQDGLQALEILEGEDSETE